MVVVDPLAGRLGSLDVTHSGCDQLVCLVDLDADFGGCFVGLVVRVDVDLVVCLAFLGVVAYLDFVVADQGRDLVCVVVVVHCLVVAHVSGLVD